MNGVLRNKNPPRTQNSPSKVTSNSSDCERAAALEANVLPPPHPKPNPTPSPPPPNPTNATPLLAPLAAPLLRPLMAAFCPPASIRALEAQQQKAQTIQDARALAGKAARVPRDERPARNG